MHHDRASTTPQGGGVEHVDRQIAPSVLEKALLYDVVARSLNLKMRQKSVTLRCRRASPSNTLNLRVSGLPMLSRLF